MCINPHELFHNTLCSLCGYIRYRFIPRICIAICSTICSLECCNNTIMCLWVSCRGGSSFASSLNGNSVCLPPCLRRHAARAFVLPRQSHAICLYVGLAGGLMRKPAASLNSIETTSFHLLPPALPRRRAKYPCLLQPLLQLVTTATWHRRRCQLSVSSRRHNSMRQQLILQCDNRA